MQSRVERTLWRLHRVLRDLLQPLGDGVAVHWPESHDFQNQQVQCSLGEIDASHFYTLADRRVEVQGVAKIGGRAGGDIVISSMKSAIAIVVLAAIAAIAAEIPEAPLGTYKPAERKFWAFQARRDVAPPALRDAWVATPVDAFILQGLQKAGLKPAPEADRITLIRRVTYDLHGIPPTPAEIDAFIQDKSPKAWEHLVDRLLASPHYGEQWGRHWLDVVRFAESEG
jgi:hypothetical protein